ncbi:MAG: hypothetical protein Q8L56_15960 [Rhodocyclaceae bacterium]|nr:hypothetical protein [Rhodocyclaceae bacterium]
MSNGTMIREMAATEHEFRHGLTFAFPQGVTEHDGAFHVVHAGAAMEIVTEPLPPRIIAALRLPVLSVRIRFTAGTPERQQEMLARMDRAMLRGGG